MFSALSNTEIFICATFISSSADTFNLVLSKILLFGKELTVRADAFILEINPINPFPDDKF